FIAQVMASLLARTGACHQGISCPCRPLQQPCVRASDDSDSPTEDAEILASVHRRWVRFFWRHCRAGFPWFWPAWPPGQHGVVAVRGMVLCHLVRARHPLRRNQDSVLVTITCAPSVFHGLGHGWNWFPPGEAVLRGVQGFLRAAIRHNILPVEYYMYQLWQ